MTTSDVVVVLGAVCGVLMVLGGLLLFYKGIVTLREASNKPDAITLELKNILKIQSRYPAYGFFAFGLAFMALSVYFSRPDGIQPIRISGAVENAADPGATSIRVILKLWADNLSSDGTFSRDLYPDLKQVRIEIQAPGSEPETMGLDVHASDVGSRRVASFGPVKLKKVGGEPGSGSVENVSSGTLPPIAAATGLKE